VGVGGRGEVVVVEEEAAAPAALVVLVQATLAMISRTCSLCHAVACVACMSVSNFVGEFAHVSDFGHDLSHLLFVPCCRMCCNISVLLRRRILVDYQCPISHTCSLCHAVTCVAIICQ
jgi:hypothetical protein